jgi:hypothetical protein
MLVNKNPPPVLAHQGRMRGSKLVAEYCPFILSKMGGKSNGEKD